MALPLHIQVKESLKELRAILKNSSPLLQPRIKMLIAIKKAGDNGISKRALMDSMGVCSQSIHNWRTNYLKGGIKLMLQNGRIGKSGRPSVFTKEESKAMEAKLKDPKNGLSGYVELQQWIEKEFQKEVKYNTILKYSMRHFGSKVKVARKSHVKKSPDAVNAFKKTSVRK